MPKKTVQSEVESSGYDLMQGLAKVVKTIKQAVADGFQPGQDLPPVVVAAVAEMPALVAAAKDVPADAAEDKLELVKGANIGVYDVIDAATK